MQIRFQGIQGALTLLEGAKAHSSLWKDDGYDAFMSVRLDNYGTRDLDTFGRLVMLASGMEAENAFDSVMILFKDGDPTVYHLADERNDTLNAGVEPLPRELSLQAKALLERLPVKRVGEAQPLPDARKQPFIEQLKNWANQAQ